MKTITFTLIAVSAAFFAASCTSSPKKPSTTAPDTTATVAKVDTTQQFYGTYEGTLPAADCEGIKTTLTLNKDTTYRLVSEYLGENCKPAETNGVYEQIGKDIVMLITPSSGEKTYYKIGKASVTLTDSLGTPNTGELAEFYVLKLQK